jgi:hypothetical protein
MRNKKDSALGVKFKSGNMPPDSITNMEGALHTFVTPLVLAYMHGDYIFDNRHQIRPFEDQDNFQQARLLVVSASIQPDFEGKKVMLLLCGLQDEPFEGRDLGPDFPILGTVEKQDTVMRAKYDTSLKRHMVAHLMQEGRLPGLDDVPSTSILSVNDAIDELSRIISSTSPSTPPIPSLFVRLHSKSVIALELLIHVSLHQLRNELSALEVLCPIGGYIYTFDPASIFAQHIGATLLNRILLIALKHLASTSVFKNMRAFAFNDYADRDAVDLVRSALKSQPQVRVLPKWQLFTGRNSQGLRGYYSPPVESGLELDKGMEDALLVIHNNSDAFGQNIESEWASGSLDGAVGASSSASASLERGRADLLDILV